MGKIIDLLYKVVDKMNGTEPVIPKKEETLVEYCAKKKQLQFDKSYLRMARIWSNNSKAIKRKVGCLIVKDGMIISCGVNGMLPHQSNECEYLENNRNATREELIEAYNKGEHLITKDEVIHAEMNSLLKCSRYSVSCEGATLYCTTACCINCAKHIIMAGIARFVYTDDYHSTDGLELLKRAGIEVVKIEI